MKASVQKITPQKARVMLKNNPSNRKVNDRHVTKLATSMRAGDWKDNGQSIVFSQQGALMDGQHRLHAIIESETPIKMLVVEGADNDAVLTIDSGKARNLADSFEIYGHSYSTAKSNVTNMLIKHHLKALHKQQGGMLATGAISFERKIQCFMEHEAKLTYWVKEIRRQTDIGGLNLNQLAYACFMLERVYNKKKVLEFIDFMKEGGDYKGSPSHKISIYVASRKKELARLRSEDLMIILYFFDFWIKGEQMPEKIFIQKAYEHLETCYPSFPMKLRSLTSFKHDLLSEA